MIDKDTRILIIDDEIDICIQLSGLLSDVGYLSDYRTSSEEGLEILREEASAGGDLLQRSGAPQLIGSQLAQRV